MGKPAVEFSDIKLADLPQDGFSYRGQNYLLDTRINILFRESRAITSDQFRENLQRIGDREGQVARRKCFHCEPEAVLTERKLTGTELNKLSLFRRHEEDGHGCSGISTGQDVPKPHEERVNTCEDFIPSGAIGTRKRAVDGNESGGTGRYNQNASVDDSRVLPAYVRLDSD